MCLENEHENRSFEFVFIRLIPSSVVFRRFNQTTKFSVSVGVNFRESTETEMFVDIGIDGFDTCK
jgi:hypothetical protein